MRIFFELSKLSCLVGMCCAFVSLGAGAEDSNEFGSAGVEVSDGGQLKLYNELLSELGSKDGYFKRSWLTDEFEFHSFSTLSKDYKEIVSENGGADFPDYPVDVLGLGTLAGYRNYAKNKLASADYIPNDQDCGASVEYLYGMLVSSTLSDIAPQYASFIQGPEQIKNTRLWGQYNLSVDMPLLQKMCGAPKYERVVSGVENLLDMLRADQEVYLAAIGNQVEDEKKRVAAVFGGNVPSPTSSGMTIEKCLKAKATPYFFVSSAGVSEDRKEFMPLVNLIKNGAYEFKRAFVENDRCYQEIVVNGVYQGTTYVKGLTGHVQEF